MGFLYSLLMGVPVEIVLEGNLTILGKENMCTRKHGSPSRCSSVIEH